MADEGALSDIETSWLVGVDALFVQTTMDAHGAALVGSGICGVVEARPAGPNSPSGHRSGVNGTRRCSNSS